MKKFIIILVLVLGFGFAKSQTYVPFPTTIANWNEIFFKQGPGGCPPDYCHHSYIMLGDTILNTQSYHKIFRTDSLNTFYQGGLREAGKQIFFFDRNCPYENVLYNFNLNVGDSIENTCGICDTTGLGFFSHVTSIDSILLTDMTYRKRINFDGRAPWIEGIGCTDGLLYTYDCLLCICWNQLVCFKEDSSYFYLNETNETCFNYTVSTNEFPNNKIHIDIFPNPITDISYIEINNSDFDNLIIYNSLGSIVKEVKIKDQRKIELNKIDFNHGVFIYKLSTATGKYQIGKFIVQ